MTFFSFVSMWFICTFPLTTVKSQWVETVMPGTEASVTGSSNQLQNRRRLVAQVPEQVQ